MAGLRASTDLGTNHCGPMGSPSPPVARERGLRRGGREERCRAEGSCGRPRPSIAAAVETNQEVVHAGSPRGLVAPEHFLSLGREPLPAPPPPAVGVRFQANWDLF